MYGGFFGTKEKKKKNGHNNEVTVLPSWPQSEVPLNSTNKMAGLLFPIIPPQKHERKFRHDEICREDYSDQELRSRYRFGRD